MSFNLEYIISIIPEIIVLGLAMVVLLGDLFVSRENKRYVAYFALAGLLVALVQTVRMKGYNIPSFYGMFMLDSYAVFFKVVFLIAALFAVALSVRYIKEIGIERGEYYSLMLFATSGMMIMASGTDLISIYLGLELMALSIYILVGFNRERLESNEAALKYFLLGAFSSGILLYGIAVIYGVTGTTSLDGVAAFIRTGEYSRYALLIGVIMIAAGFAFKVAAAPFHMWAPDVYQGAPTSVTAFMSIGPKAAAFSAFLRVFITAFPDVKPDWTLIIACLAVLSMLIGNVVAIAQTNIKRMLAYSSIAHAGYALVGFAAGGEKGVTSVMLYLLIYTFMNAGAFGIVVMLRRCGATGEEISDLAGLARKNKLAALFMLIFMFSLAGIPPTAGFIGKFYIFMAALNAGLLWLAIIGVLMSAVSAYFYLRIVKIMYMDEPVAEFELEYSITMKVAMGVIAVFVVYYGMYPADIVEFARGSLAGLI